MPSSAVTLDEIAVACEKQGSVKVFTPFLRHFGNIEPACVLSEICVCSARALAADPESDGWFRRTYESWDIATGIPATNVRNSCVGFAEKGLVQLEKRNRVTHFRAVPEKIALLPGVLDNKPFRERPSLGMCPECGEPVIEGKSTYYCSSWTRDHDNACEFKLWKNVLERNGKSNISREEVAALLDNKHIRLEKIVGKSSKVFTCDGALDKGANGRYGIKFIFV